MFKLARDGVSPVSQEDRTFLPLFPLTQIKDHKKTTKWHPCQCVCGPAAPRIIGGSGSLEVQGPVLCGGRTVLTSKLVVRNEETCRVLSFWVGALTSMDCTPWGPDTVGYRLCKNCNLQKHTHTQAYTYIHRHNSGYEERQAQPHILDTHASKDTLTKQYLYCGLNYLTVCV